MKEVFIGSENLLKLIRRWAKDHRVYVPVTFDIMNNEETPDYDLVKDEEKEVILHVFQQGASLTEKGSLTYLYNIKRKLNKKS